MQSLLIGEWSLSPALGAAIGLAGAVYGRGIAALGRRAVRGRRMWMGRAAAFAGGLIFCSSP